MSFHLLNSALWSTKVVRFEEIYLIYFFISCCALGFISRKPLLNLRSRTFASMDGTLLKAWREFRGMRMVILISQQNLSWASRWLGDRCTSDSFYEKKRSKPLALLVAWQPTLRMVILSSLTDPQVSVFGLILSTNAWQHLIYLHLSSSQYEQCHPVSLALCLLVSSLTDAHPI